jgi:predicted nucleotidyltransferase component of viral defense system
MHPEILVPATAKCFEKLGQQDFMTPYYLIGGTAVALHMGHRQSVDLDFVCPDPVNTLQLRQSLSKCGKFDFDSESKDTLYGMLDGVKLSVMTYDYPLLEKTVQFQNVAVAGLKDLAAMKLDVIASRGKKRDFVDIYAIAQTGITLQEMWCWFHEKYAKLNTNPMHIIKSLSYFEDADQDPDPIFIKKLDWNAVKAFFLRESRKIAP